MINFEMVKKIAIIYKFVLSPAYKFIDEEISNYKAKRALRSKVTLGEDEPIIKCLLASMSKLAKIDGVISNAERECVKHFLKVDCRYDEVTTRWCIYYFNQTANDSGTLRFYTKTYYKLVKGDYDRCFTFASLLMRLSFADNEFHQEERKAMINTIKLLKLPKYTFDKLLFEEKLSRELPYDRIKDYGTGFLITEDGFVLTNYHNICRGQEIKVRSENDLYEARIIHYDKNNDLVLLKIDGDFKAIPIAVEYPYLGQSIFTIGFPQPIIQGFLPKISRGSICGLAGYKDDSRHLQIDATIQPGNSGGPLIDSEKGFVIGIIKAILKDTNKVSYAIGLEILQNFIESCQGLSSHLGRPTLKKRKFQYIINDTKHSVVQIFSC